MQIDLFKEALSSAAEQLMDRHAESAKSWFPHMLVPYSRGTDFEPEWVFDSAESPLNEIAQSALYINLLTEDNLPYYTSILLEHLGKDSVWGEWSRRWTAEEARHSVVIRDYLTVIRGIDPVELELGRMQTMSTGWDAGWENFCDGLVYPSLQELATRISHRNTGRFVDDEAGKTLISRVVTDENLHFLFYRDLVSEAIKVDPSTVVLSINRVVQNFAMPGVGIDGFLTHAKRVASAGIYDFSVHHDQILQPVVMRHYGLESIEGLSPEAEQAREETIRFIDRIGKVGTRQREKREASTSPEDVAAAAVLA